MTKVHNSKNIFNIVVIVAALGYFVDIYDLILFSIVRVPSLKAIGIPDAGIKDAGIYLINMQMIGMLIGGIVWGIMGDKKGRLAALFLTILLYSLANIANGFAQNLQQYAFLRIIAGFGLAGELGIGITLVSEVMSKETRGWGTSIVSGVGLAGAVLAFFIAKWGWREAYWVGGILGLLLLGLRIYVHESGMFDKVKESKARRGDFFSLFSGRKRFIKYIACILAGAPVWFVIGILVSFSKEMGEYLGVVNDAGQPETINIGKAVMYHYIGAAIGSILTGYISQKLKSRKKALLIAIISVGILCVVYFNSFGVSSSVFFFVIFILGIAQGYWAVLVTVASEQFGTNIRSTAATTVPNFIRGSTVLMTLWWSSMSAGMGILRSAMIVGATVIVLAIIAVFFLEESYGKDLDYFEVE
ncbi:MAG: MFS transporter [Bacteroidetes bacterium]|nr:MFS transporter [Bacteroidota bacterium]